MKIWRRAPVSFVCGYCAEVFLTGEPQLVIDPGRLNKLRCRSCAGESVLTDLPPLQVITKPIATVVTTRALPFDYKQAQMAQESSEDDA